MLELVGQLGRVHGIGADDGHVDRRAMELGNQRQGVIADGRLGGAIDSLTRHGHDAAQRGHVDDLAAAARLHDAQGRPAAVDRPHEVDLDLLLELILGQLISGPRVDDTGIVDEDVDRAQLGLNAVGESLPGSGVADVVDVDERSGASGGQFLAQGFELVFLDVGQHEDGPFFGQEAGRGRANPAGRAGDDDDFIFDVFAHGFFLRSRMGPYPSIGGCLRQSSRGALKTGRAMC